MALYQELDAGDNATACRVCGATLVRVNAVSNFSFDALKSVFGGREAGWSGIDEARPAREDSRVRLWLPDQAPGSNVLRRRQLMQLITIATFDTVTEAHMAKNMLHTEGIEAFLADEYAVRGRGNRPEGLPKLQVSEDQAERATQLLHAVKKRP
jgi:hypothetical protein